MPQNSTPRPGARMSGIVLPTAAPSCAGVGRGSSDAGLGMIILIHIGIKFKLRSGRRSVPSPPTPLPNGGRGESWAYTVALCRRLNRREELSMPSPRPPLGRGVGGEGTERRPLLSLIG